MTELIGELLPLALVVGISPLPLTSVVVLLSTSRPLVAGSAFLLGWSGAVAAVVTVVALLAEPADEGTVEDPSTWVPVGKIAIGVVVLLLALREWRKRPASGAEPTAPKWLVAMDAATPRQAVAFGAALAALNLKHLPMFIAGGFAISARPLTLLAGAVAVATFVVVASAPVAAPVVGHLIAPERMTATLGAFRAWLVQNNAVVMALLLLVIGVVVIGSGLADV